MAKVGKHTFKHQSRQLSFEVDVNFGAYGGKRADMKDKYFWIAFPEEVKVYNNGIGFASGKISEDAIRNFDEVMKEYYAQSQKKRKVIGYQFSGEIGRRDDYDKYIFREHEMRFEFVIGTITTMGGKEFFSETKGDKMHPLVQSRNEYTGFVFIDHTEELEDWFVNTWTTFKSIIEKCDKFFKQPKDKFLLSIHQTNLLPEPNKK